MRLAECPERLGRFSQTRKEFHTEGAIPWLAHKCRAAWRDQLAGSKCAVFIFLLVLSFQAFVA